jgi:hypothetical protein
VWSGEKLKQNCLEVVGVGATGSRTACLVVILVAAVQYALHNQKIRGRVDLVRWD